MADKAKAPREGKSNDALIKKAISEGRALIDQGKTKIDAAMAIYRLLEKQPQETVVSAFIEGATLTEKGALSGQQCDTPIWSRLKSQARHVT